MQYVLCTSVEKSPQTNPIIARIDCKAGHGGGRPLQKVVKYIFHNLVVINFVCYVVNLPDPFSTNGRLMNVPMRFPLWPRCWVHPGLNR